jgi:hypothetical protein
MPKEVRIRKVKRSDTITTQQQTKTKGPDMADIIAHKFTVTDAESGKTMDQYIKPELAPILRRILDEEGYEEITEEPVTELPEGYKLG